MITATTKKDLQKAIKAIRDTYTIITGEKQEYPKAMMTGQQEEKNTATVNCGRRPWVQDVDQIANIVMNDPLFKAFLAQYKATANFEINSEGNKQIRINF